MHQPHVVPHSTSEQCSRPFVRASETVGITVGYFKLNFGWQPADLSRDYFFQFLPPRRAERRECDLANGVYNLERLDPRPCGLEQLFGILRDLDNVAGYGGGGVCSVDGGEGGAFHFALRTRVPIRWVVTSQILRGDSVEPTNPLLRAVL